MIDFQGFAHATTDLPAQMGRFKIVRQLGHGAQSVVYLAFDPQLLREVAVKVLQGEAQNADALLNEARAVSRLNHASIVPVFEAGHDAQSGAAYLVFEYVVGPTLADVLREQGALEPSLAVKMLVPVLDAVAYAHANGVIHRDLKPSNILMDRRGMARVMDFGIAVRQTASQAGEADVKASDDEDDELQAPLGTPAYMAPEYIQQGLVSPQMDVFSAGLVLFEMLTGQRAAVSGTGMQALQFLASHDISLPDTTRYPVDDRLRAALARALARDPALRYLHMADFVQALRTWGEPLPEATAGQNAVHGVGAGRAGAAATVTAQAVALEGLLRRIRLKSELPALPESLLQITRLASSDQQNLGVLTAAILRDTAVTQKLLRMANSAGYRSFGGGAVSTVSRAVQLLGYSAVRTATAALPLLDLSKNQAQAGRVLDEIALAHFCGTLARELSGWRERDAEEAFVCASVQRLGRLLVTCYLTDETAEIERSVQSESLSRDHAARQVLGLSFGALGRGVAKHWGLPDTVVRSMRTDTDFAPEAGNPTSHSISAVAPPAAHAETLRLLSAFAAALTEAWMLDTTDRCRSATALASQRYAKALNVTTQDIKAGILAAESAVKAQLKALRQDIHCSEVAGRLGWAFSRAQPVADTGISASAAHRAEPESTAHVSSPCREILANAVQDLASRLLQPYKLNEVVQSTLEALQRAGGFRQVIFCLRDAKANMMIGRIAVGASVSGDKDPARLRIPMDNLTDVVASSAHTGEDLWLPDVTTSLATTRPPSAHCLPALAIGGLLLLPLHLKGQPLGLIYAEIGKAGALLSEKDVAMMSTLRNQVALAFRQRMF